MINIIIITIIILHSDNHKNDNDIENVYRRVLGKGE